MASRKLQYEVKVTSLSSLDGTVNLEPALQMDNRRPHTLQIVAGYITSNIPNVYNYGGSNNGLCQISNGTSTINLQLPNGTYQIDEIMSAINDAAASWYTDTADPAFILRANTVVEKAYIIIDSTKLSAGTQFSIDFNYGSSLMYQLLGFVTTKSFNADGTYTGSDYPQLDWMGNMVDVYLSGFGPLSIHNGQTSEFVFAFNLATSSVTNLYTYPGSSNINSPEIPIRCPSALSQFSVKFVGDRENRAVVAFDGLAYVEFIIREY